MSIKLLSKIAEFARLVSVVLLMDMRTRFGASYFGYLIAVGWPLMHLLILEGAFVLRNLVAPIGDSPAVFVATGVVPYILCIYPARMLAMTMGQGRVLLNLPILRPVHLIAARWILEGLTAFTVLSLFILILYLIDIEFYPADPLQAAEAVFAAVYLGVGLGVLNTVMTAIIGPYYVVIFTLFIIVLYFMSGAYLPSTTLSEEMREYSVYNPLFVMVEWLRSAYYTSYDPYSVDKKYVIEVASASLALGLLGERFVRGRFFS